MFVVLKSIAELEQEPPNHVVAMYAHGRAHINTRIVNEREISFIGDLGKNPKVAALVLKIPSFVKYKSYFQEKYGLSEKEFQDFKEKLQQTKRGSVEHKRLKQDY